MKLGDWIEVEGTLKKVPVENGGETLVLFADRASFYKKPLDEFVYFS